MPVLKNVEVQWAKVFEPDTAFEHMWSLKAILTQDHQEQLVSITKTVDPKGKGVKIKVEDGEASYRFKRKVNKADGSGNNTPPLVCGPAGPTDIFNLPIGNGSICNIQYKPVAYDNKFGKGVLCDLQGVQVLVHVPYGTQDGDEFGEEGEPLVTKPAPSESNDYDDEDFT